MKNVKRPEKKDPRLLKLKEWVDKQYEGGRNTVIGNHELLEVMQTETPDLWQELSGE